MSDHPQNDHISRPLRVLLIVDSLYWVIGNFALHIQKNNPQLNALICSKFTILHMIKRFGQFPMPFDLVHCITQTPLNVFWGQLPIITSFHHGEARTTLKAFQQSDGIMTVSRQWRDHLINLGISPEKLALIPYGVDFKAFHPPSATEQWNMRKELHIPQDTFVIGFSGKSSSDTDGRKGLDCYLQGINEIAKKIPNLRALLMGAGWQKLAGRLKDHGIPTTHLPFQFEHHHIAKFYQVLDVFWVTSKVEGGPVTLLEAMACGIPCISTPVGGALDVLKDQINGFIVPFDRPDLFAELSFQLSQDKKLRQQIGEEASKTIKHERQWSQAREKTLKLYYLAKKNFKKRPEGDQIEDMAYMREMNPGQNDKLPSLISLDLYSLKIQRWMKTCEHINGVRTLMKMKEWKGASALTARAMKSPPTDPYLWKQFIKAFRIKRPSHQIHTP